MRSDKLWQRRVSSGSLTVVNTEKRMETNTAYLCGFLDIEQRSKTYFGD
jgi:hypothetical protein